MIMADRVREALSTFGYQLVRSAGRISEDCSSDNVTEVYITIRIDADDATMDIQKTYVSFPEVAIDREKM